MLNLRDAYLACKYAMNLLFPCLWRGIQFGASASLLMLLLRPTYKQDAMNLGFLIGLGGEVISTHKKLIDE